MPSSSLETFFEVVVRFDNEKRAKELANILNFWEEHDAEVREVAK